MNPKPITVIIADDHEFFRGGVTDMLNKSNDIKVVAQASNGEQLLEIAEKYVPDVILMDIQMPGISGIEATRIITKKLPSIAVIALTMRDNKFTIADMMDAGARGYLLKEASKEVVMEGIRTVNKNREFFCNGASQTIHAALSVNVNDGNSGEMPIKEIRFTEREKQISKMICEGLSAPQMSKKIFLSAKTIENYRARLLQKAGCKNVAQFAFFMSKNKLYDP